MAKLIRSRRSKTKLMPRPLIRSTLVENSTKLTELANLPSPSSSLPLPGRKRRRTQSVQVVDGQVCPSVCVCLYIFVCPLRFLVLELKLTRLQPQLQLQLQPHKLQQERERETLPSAVVLVVFAKLTIHQPFNARALSFFLSLLLAAKRVSNLELGL